MIYVLGCGVTNVEYDEKPIITISIKQAITFLLALGSAIGLPLFINGSTETVRHDPFTGTQGAALERRIDALESSKLECQAQIREMYRSIERNEKCCNRNDHDH